VRESVLETMKKKGKEEEDADKWSQSASERKREEDAG